MRKLLFSIMLAAIVMPAGAHEFIGAVFNEKEKPVKKMKVWRKNTTESVVTGSDGQFLFKELNANDTLVISANKKFEAIIPVGTLKNVTVKLGKKEFYVHDGTNEMKMEYAEVKRKDNQSNILTRQQIQEINAESIYDLLRGRIPGLTINYGEDGQYISIRGGNSLSLDTEPIFVVDGVVHNSSGEVDSSLNISDIESVEVQKDGNAWGVRGSNGAIIITTVKKQ